MRSAFAAKTLQDLGYTDVVSIIGGFNKWKDEGLRLDDAAGAHGRPARSATSATSCCPKSARRASTGSWTPRCSCSAPGGLGSPAALYLAAAGVGTIGIIDMDVVDTSNLQRQILHNVERVGMRKVDSAKMTLTAMNPDVEVVTYDTRLGADNILDIIDGYDVIVDGTDNFPTRYLVNDAALIKNIPVVHGSIFRFEGQVTVFNPLRRTVLSLHDPRAATAGVRAELRRGGRARRPAGHRRIDPGASRRSSCCWNSATRWSVDSSPTTRSTRRSGPSRSVATRRARPAARTPAPS